MTLTLSREKGNIGSEHSLVEVNISAKLPLLLRGCVSLYGSAAYTIVDVGHALTQMASMQLLVEVST